MNNRILNKLLLIFISLIFISIALPISIMAENTDDNHTHDIQSHDYIINYTKTITNQDNDNDDDDNDDDDDDDGENDPFNNNDDDEVNDPFANDDDNNDEVNDPFNDNNDGDADDPFNNDNSDDINDPFNDSDDKDGDNNYSDLFGDDDDDDETSFVPKPDIMVGGYVGLGMSSVFLGDNRYTDELDPDEPRNIYLASDSFGNLNADYKFYSFRLFADFDFTATIDTSGIPKFDIEPKELYVSFVSNNAVVNLGHLIIEWSQMDIYSLTNYFNPYSSTIYSKQLLEGVNGVHGQFYFMDNMSFELIMLPLFTESSLSTSRLNVFLGGIGDLGETDIDDYLIGLDGDDFGGIFNDLTNTGDEDENDAQPIPPTTPMADTTPPKPDIKNTQLGFRYGVTFSGIDLYLMYFHGYYNSPLITYTYEEPDLDDPGDPSDDSLTGADDYGALATGGVVMEFKRVYRMIDSFALSTSFNLWEITFKGEMAFTLNSPLIFKRTVYIESTGVFVDRALTTAPTIHASLGLDWEFLDDFRLIAEYSEFFILEDVNVDEETIPGNTIFATIAYTLSLDTFDVIFAQGAHYDYKDQQLVSISYIQMDFLNGFYAEFGLGYLNDFGAVIDGEENLEGIFGPVNRSFVFGILMYYEF